HGAKQMAKIYSPPAEVGPVPTYNWREDHEVNAAREDEWIERLRQWCRENGSGDLVGEVVRDQVADGYAQYMVMSNRPLTLIHLPVVDAWQSRWAHRWTVKDVREMVDRQRRMAELFSRR